MQLYRPYSPPARPPMAGPRPRADVRPASPRPAPQPPARPASAAQPMPSQSQGTPYNPQQRVDGWPEGLQPFTATYKGFDGTMSNTPNFGQRDAFISQLNSQLGQMQSQSMFQPTGAPMFNFPKMWNQAGKMVEQGWQNPFAMQQGIG